MRSGAHHPINIPFEIERSNCICEQRRYSCRARLFYFFQNSSHFFVIDVQSWAIFKTGKNGMFFWRFFILREAQAKNKKKTKLSEVRKNLFYKKNTIRSFLYKKNGTKSGPPWTLFSFSKTLWSRPAKFRGVFFFQRTAKTRQIVVKIFQDQ